MTLFLTIYCRTAYIEHTGLEGLAEAALISCDAVPFRNASLETGVAFLAFLTANTATKSRIDSCLESADMLALVSVGLRRQALVAQIFSLFFTD